MNRRREATGKGDAADRVARIEAATFRLVKLLKLTRLGCMDAHTRCKDLTTEAVSKMVATMEKEQGVAKLTKADTKRLQLEAAALVDAAIAEVVMSVRTVWR